MTQKFECIEKHFYRRQYQTAGGDWSTLFYAIFTDWKGKRRTFPLGETLEDARDSLGDLKTRNKGRYDFDAEKEKGKQGVTFSAWCNRYFATMISSERRQSGVKRDKGSYKQLEPFFGSMFLSEIRTSKIMEYKVCRLEQPIIRLGKPTGKKVSFATANRDLGFLHRMLNLAAEDGIIEAVPKIKLQSEKSRKRDRVVTEEEYETLSSNLPRPHQRVLICLYETAMRINEVLRLTWDRVDLKAGFIRLRAEDVKEKNKRNTPIVPELRAVLMELKAEQGKVASINQLVFTKAGKLVSYGAFDQAFVKAARHAKIDDVRPHDFRHTCITRWSMAGIPSEAVMAASGHSSIEMHKRYVNPKDSHLKQAFNLLTGRLQEKSAASAESVNS